MRGQPGPPIIENAHAFITFYHLLPRNILVCPPKIFDKSTPVYNYVHLYSASCSAHQSEVLPVRETQRGEAIVTDEIRLRSSRLLSASEASIPLRPWCIFPSVSDFPPIFEKFNWKIFNILPFPEKFIDFHPRKFLITFFLVVDHKF